MPVPSSTVGAQVLEAFGLPVTGCTKLVVTFERTQIVTAEATYTPDKEGLDAMNQVIVKLRDCVRAFQSSSPDIQE